MMKFLKHEASLNGTVKTGMRRLMVLALVCLPITLLADEVGDDLVEMDAEVVSGVLTGDVFKAFPELWDEYDTPLKQKHFLLTDEGKTRLAEVKAMKPKILETLFYVEPDLLFGLGKYDLKKKRFSVALGFYNKFMAEAPKRHYRFGGCHFPQLPVKRKEAHTGLHYEPWINVTVPETQALLIENDDSSTLRLVFKVKSKTFPTKSFSYESGKMENVRIPVAYNVELQFVSASNGEVYFSKKY